MFFVQSKIMLGNIYVKNTDTHLVPLIDLLIILFIIGRRSIATFQVHRSNYLGSHFNSRTNRLEEVLSITNQQLEIVYHIPVHVVARQTLVKKGLLFSAANPLYSRLRSRE